MEKKENNRKDIVIGVLVAIIFVLAGLIVYFVFVEKNNDIADNNNCPKCEECEKCQNNLTNDECNDNKKLIAQHLSTEIGDFLVTIEGDVYYTPSGNDKSYGNVSENVKKVLGNPSTYTLSEDINPYDGKPNLYNYKLDLSNIKYAIEVVPGMAAIPMTTILFLSYDGKIADLTYSIMSPNDNTTSSLMFTKEVPGYSNIANIVIDYTGTYVHTSPLLIDSCNNKYLYSYSLYSN